MGTKKGNIVRTIAIFAKDLGVMKIKNKSCENEKKILWNDDCCISTIKTKNYHN